MLNLDSSRILPKQKYRVLFYSGSSIFDVIRSQMRQFERHLKTLFFVSISVQHEYYFETNQSRPYENIAGGIVGEVKTRFAFIVNLFDWASFTGLFTIFTVYMF
uniref:Uncharacterized protein n=1 Tax=Cacopsylla melanoneura TaxID=428564 RepID=A0A8D9B226_9HEMI